MQPISRLLVYFAMSIDVTFTQFKKKSITIISENIERVKMSEQKYKKQKYGHCIGEERWPQTCITYFTRILYYIIYTS